MEENGQKVGTNKLTGQASPKESFKKPFNATKEKEKLKLNIEIQRVTNMINNLEKERGNEKLDKGVAKFKDEKSGSQSQGHQGFASHVMVDGVSELGGTSGSPVIIYHGATGSVEGLFSFKSLKC